MHDQFYWAERMFWLGVAPEPLKRNHLLPDTSDNASIHEAATVLSRAINNALSPKVKTCAVEIAARISMEVIRNLRLWGCVFVGDISETPNLSVPYVFSDFVFWTPVKSQSFMKILNLILLSIFPSNKLQKL